MLFGWYFFAVAEALEEEADAVAGDVGYAALFGEDFRKNVFLFGFELLQPGSGGFGDNAHCNATIRATKSENSLLQSSFVGFTMSVQLVALRAAITQRFTFLPMSMQQ